MPSCSERRSGCLLTLILSPKSQTMDGPQLVFSYVHTHIYTVKPNVIWRKIVVNNPEHQINLCNFTILHKKSAWHMKLLQTNNEHAQLLKHLKSLDGSCPFSLKNILLCWRSVMIGPKVFIIDTNISPIYLNIYVLFQICYHFCSWNSHRKLYGWIPWMNQPLLTLL